MATEPMISAGELRKRMLSKEFEEQIRRLLAEPQGGCNACRFADPFSDRLCTIPDISDEDFDLGVSGVNCSRFEPFAPASHDECASLHQDMNTAAALSEADATPKDAESVFEPTEEWLR